MIMVYTNTQFMYTDDGNLDKAMKLRETDA
jgi:hypothetical protein